MRPPSLPAPQARAPSADAAWQALYDAACAPYRRAGRFAWHWARGKLAHDPVFRGLLERGDLPAQGRVLDIGCGLGLMASLLQACADVTARGRWPASWQPPPVAAAYTGIERARRDVARGQAALRALALAPRLVCADLRDTELPACDVVVILDVLHYIDHPAQRALLQRVRAALAESAGPGRLLLRVGDAANTRGFALSLWLDRVVALLRGQSVPRRWGRPLGEWIELLRELGWTVRSVPMSQGTPYANVLLVADLPGRPR